jgi:bla regulator protein blaR1
MITTTSIAILNHLWQSSLFAAAVWALTLLLRRNAARPRYWLWLAASVKFLIPFSILVIAGSFLDSRRDPQPSVTTIAMEQVFEAPALTFATTPPATKQQAFSNASAMLLATWLCGFTLVLFRWWRQWRRIRTAVHEATQLDLALPIRVLSSPTLLEPGVFGVFRPVLLLPEGITERLAAQQFQAILAHELCHVRCQDNLCAAMQMLVEAMFWFHPLVWWIGKRMVDERERACDEEVLRLGNDPQIYAESILKVCTLYLESPIACVAGVTGSNLRKRIRGIMTNRIAQKLDTPRKLIVAAAGIGTIAAPILFGILNAPATRAQSAASTKRFDVASVKAASPKNRPDVRVSPTGIDYTAYSVRALIADAYNFRLASISSPDSRTKDLINGAFFDISAKTDRPVSRAELNQMLQSLLRDRFKLTLHHELRTESVYTLTTVASGMKLRESASEGPLESRIRPEGGVHCKNMTMQIFSEFLTARLSRVVLDETGLNGQYDFELKLDGLPSMSQLQEAASSGNMEAAGAMKRKMVDWTESSIFSDIQKQLGLKLESGRASVDNLIVDHAERPTEN